VVTALVSQHVARVHIPNPASRFLLVLDLGPRFFPSSFPAFTKTKVSSSNSIQINELLLTSSSEFFRVSYVSQFFNIFSQTNVIRKPTSANQRYNLIEVKIYYEGAFYTADVVEFDKSQI